jgi:hypothetical protein
VSAKIIPIQAYRTASIPALDYELEATARQTESGSAPAQASFEDIYPSADDDTFVAVIRQKLLEAEQRLQAAKDGDEIDRDDAINSLKADLPILFAKRQWGEGGLAVLVALHHGLQNCQGTPLNFDAFYAVLSVVRRFANAPFLTFYQALDLVDVLQSAGLNTDPAEARLIQEMLHD